MDIMSLINSLEEINEIVYGNLNLSSEEYFKIRELCVEPINAVEKELNIKEWKGRIDGKPVTSCCRYIVNNDERYSMLTLSIDFFTMTNDSFFEKWGFNFVPDGDLHTKVKSFVHSNSSKVVNTAKASYVVNGTPCNRTINAHSSLGKDGGLGSCFSDVIIHGGN